MPTHITTNRDNAGLEPRNAGGSLTGCVEEVNGYGASEVPEFVPTRAELLGLVKYYQLTFLERAYSCFLVERRAKHILGLLGDEAGVAICEEKDAFARRIGDPEWREFCEYCGYCGYLGPNFVYEIP